MLLASLCACSRRSAAEKLIAEYQEQSELVREQISENMVPFSEEEWQYVIAYALYWGNEAMITTGKNWNLDTVTLEQQRIVLAGNAENAKVPLTEAQEKILHLYAEFSMDVGVVQILQQWLELHE